MYRGSALPDWDGVYIFGDWSTGFGQPDGTLLGPPKLIVSVPERGAVLGHVAQCARPSLARPAAVVSTLPHRASRTPPPPPQVNNAFDLSRALGFDLQPSRSDPRAINLSHTLPRQPQRGGFQSLLDPPDEGEQRTVAVAADKGRKPDDWLMQTQPYDRKSLQALTNPAAIGRSADKPAAAPQPAERARRDANLLEPANGVEAFCRGAGIDPSKSTIYLQSGVPAVYDLAILPEYAEARWHL